MFGHRSLKVTDDFYFKPIVSDEGPLTGRILDLNLPVGYQTFSIGRQPADPSRHVNGYSYKVALSLPICAQGERSIAVCFIASINQERLSDLPEFAWAMINTWRLFLMASLPIVGKQRFSPAVRRLPCAGTTSESKRNISKKWLSVQIWFLTEYVDTFWSSMETDTDAVSPPNFATTIRHEISFAGMTLDEKQVKDVCKQAGVDESFQTRKSECRLLTTAPFKDVDIIL